jgi:hypothetical protein
VKLQKGDIFFGVKGLYVVDDLWRVWLASLRPIKPFEGTIFKLLARLKNTGMSGLKFKQRLGEKMQRKYHKTSSPLNHQEEKECNTFQISS